ncbi:MAG TPA: hypothetical protein DIS78_00190, partial [Lachnospiraceae bacterium]|nr:hypothetical protein [Lachnospiraceae bacterium]
DFEFIPISTETGEYIVLTAYSGGLSTLVIPDSVSAGGDTYGVRLIDNAGGFFSNSDLEYIDIRNLDTSQVTDMGSMFSSCANLKSVSMSGIDTGNVTSMVYMFSGCPLLTYVNMDGLNVSRVVDMSNMFRGCTMLNSVYGFSNLNTDNAENMSNMFYGCENLTGIDLSNLHTARVQKMDGMFRDCEKLESIVGLGGLDTNAVTDMSYMFAGCSGIESIDLTGFDTGSVINMSSMFADCESIKSLDLSSFELSDLWYADNMFENCYSLVQIETPTSVPEGLMIALPSPPFARKDAATQKYDNLPRGSETDISFTIIRQDKYVPVSSITITPSSSEIVIDQEITLSANVAPEGATDRNVTWKSSDQGIATVDPTTGVVRGKKVGEVTITATSTGIDPEGMQVEATCTVKVDYDPDHVSRIVLDKTELSLEKGESAQLTATVYPDSAKDKTVIWSSDNPRIVDVDPKTGKVTNVTAGDVSYTAYVTATAQDKTYGTISAICKVTVNDISVKDIAFVEDSYSMIVDDTLELKENTYYIITPGNATNKSVTFTSSDEDVVKVLNSTTGLLKAKKRGTATITVMTADGSLTDQCEVTVDAVDVKSITLDKYDLKLLYNEKTGQGEQATVTAQIMPENATYKTVNWTSADPAIAVVDANGSVTATGIGTTDIIATAADDGDVRAVCTVEVTAALVESIVLTPTTVTIEVGGTVTIDALINPAVARGTRLIWTPEDPRIVYVKDGIVEGLEAGTTNIRVETPEGSVSAVCTVTVREAGEKKETRLTLVPSSCSIQIGEEMQLNATVTPTGKTVTWISNNDRVVTVTPTGIIKGISEGEATIIASVNDGLGGKINATCKVTVSKLPVRVDDFYIKLARTEIYVGEGFTIVATVIPATADIKEIIWTSRDPKIATVDSTGRVVGKSKGTVEIIATTQDGSFTDSCTVVVKNRPVDPIIPTPVPYKLHIVDDRTRDDPHKDKVRAKVETLKGDRYLLITDSNGDKLRPRINGDSSLGY